MIDVYVRYLREKVDRPFGVRASRPCAARATGCARTAGRELSRLPIRIRLTLAFTAVMAVVLVAVGVFVYCAWGPTSTPRSTRRCAARADDLAAHGGRERRLGAGRPAALVEATRASPR